MAAKRKTTKAPAKRSSTTKVTGVLSKSALVKHLAGTSGAAVKDVKAVMAALEETAPELSADIIDDGITLTGGGALLGRMDQAIAKRTGLPVRVASDALICVAMGAGQAMEEAAFHGALAAA